MPHKKPCSPAHTPVVPVLKQINRTLSVYKRHMALAIRNTNHLSHKIDLNCFWNLSVTAFHMAQSPARATEHLSRRGLDNYTALRAMHDRILFYLSGSGKAEKVNLPDGPRPEFQGPGRSFLGIDDFLMAIPFVPSPPGQPTVFGLWLSAAQKILRSEQFFPAPVSHQDVMHILVLKGVALLLHRLVVSGEPFAPVELPISRDRLLLQNLLLNDLFIQDAVLVTPREVWLTGKIKDMNSSSFLSDAGCLYNLFSPGKALLYFPSEQPVAYFSQASHLTPDFMRTMSSILS